MSTVDPRIEREEQLRRQASSPVRIGLDIALVVLHFAVWAAAGVGFVFIGDTLRLMSINQVGDGWDSRYESTGLDAVMVIAIIVGAPLGFVVTARIARLGLFVATFLPMATGLLGAAVGMLLAAGLWTPPQVIGSKVGFLSDDASGPWGAEEWISYYQPYWIPALLGLFALVLAIVVIVFALREKEKRARMAELLATGRKVAGVVSEVVATGVKVQGSPRMRFTTKFTDHLGTERWVTKTGQFPPGAVPRAGDAAVVWFDPAAPGEQSRIMVGVGPEAADATS